MQLVRLRKLCVDENSDNVESRRCVNACARRGVLHEFQARFSHKTCRVVVDPLEGIEWSWIKYSDGTAGDGREL